MNPKLTFFCELEQDALQELFGEPDVLDSLVELKASVSMGILDLSLERAEIIRKLNHAGIQVIGWLLLPKDEGYWFNLGNAPQAVTRYADFKTWTLENKLQWQGVGIDIEPDIREMEGLMQGKAASLIPILRRILSARTLNDARVTYWNLVYQMRMDGYRVDSYHFPFIVDERRVGASLLQRVAGLLDLPSDREVLMLYSSMIRPYGPGVLWSYASEAESVGVGVTGGGVQMEGVSEIRPLDWIEFSRDLRLARRQSDDIHVFSLEGCVQQGFLERLKTFEWEGPVNLPLDQARKTNVVRRGLQGFLWGSAHPFLILAGLYGIKWLISRRIPRKKK